MDFNGIPLHPLVVHAVVVLTPVAGLLAVAYAVVPRWRWALRWPLVVAAVAGAAATYVAYLSGENLEDRLQIDTALLHTHETWAGRLRIAMVVLVVAAVVAAYVMPFRTPLKGGVEREARIGLLRIPVAVVLVVVGVATLYAVYRTGDAGAHMVWDGTPK
ncbi:MAG: hypothetical protein JWO46_3216 [Nocardioidaceae bacterium]|nr:hypothetical protein [Nocardioidaceae bacterium]